MAYNYLPTTHGEMPASRNKSLNDIFIQKLYHLHISRKLLNYRF